MEKAWAGVDAGKEFHWACVLDASGRELLSRKVENDEADISRLMDEALLLAEEIIWALERFANRVVLCKSIAHGHLLEGPEDQGSCSGG